MSFLLIAVCLCMIIPSKMKKGVISLAEDVQQVCLIADENLEQENVESVICGDMIFNYCTLDIAKKSINELTNIKGIQFEFKEKTEEDLLKMFKANKVLEEEVDGMSIKYCFTPYYDKYVLLEEKKINLQLAFKEGKIVAGFPLILTGY